VVQQLSELQSAARLTRIEGEQTQQIFDVLAKAQLRYGASASQTAQTLKVFESALNSGTVSALTLKALVMAFPDAARLMTTALHTPFATELPDVHQTFGEPATRAPGPAPVSR